PGSRAPTPPPAPAWPVAGWRRTTGWPSWSEGPPGRSRSPPDEPLASPGMPELPEITALGERIDADVAGRPFAGAVPLSFSGLKTVFPRLETLSVDRLEGVGRRGIFVIFEFGGPRLLVRLSGRGRDDIEDRLKVT